MTSHTHPQTLPKPAAQNLKGSLQGCKLSSAASGQPWASLLLSLAGHEGSFWCKLLSQTLDHIKTTLKSTYAWLKAPLKTARTCRKHPSPFKQLLWLHWGASCTGPAGFCPMKGVTVLGGGTDLAPVWEYC